MLVDLLFSISEQAKDQTNFHEHIVGALVRMAIVFQNRYLQRLQILKLLKRFCYRYKSKMLTCESYLKNLFEYIDIFRVSDSIDIGIGVIRRSVSRVIIYDWYLPFSPRCTIQECMMI